MRTLERPLWAMRTEALASVQRILSGEITGRFRERAIDILGHEPTQEDLGGALNPLSVEAANGEPEVHNGVAVLRLTGMITPFGSLLSMLFGSGGGLQAFREQLHAAERDDSVKAILLDVDSPGGLVDLVPETAAEIRNASKPTLAVANTEAASAAYWLASQADSLSVTPSGQVGSIGVFARHIDESAALEAAGVKVTLIKAGKYKAEGNPFEPLSEEAEGAIQEVVDKTYSMFIADVAKGRGTTASQVKSGFGEGRMRLAKDAASDGLADHVETFDQAFARVSRASKSSGAKSAFGVESEPVDVAATSAASTATTFVLGTSANGTATEPSPAESEASPVPEPVASTEVENEAPKLSMGAKKTRGLLYGVPKTSAPAWRL